MAPKAVRRRPAAASEQPGRRRRAHEPQLPLAVDGAAAAAPVDPLAPLAVPLAVHAGAAAAPEDHVAPVPAPLAVGDGVAAAPVDPVAHSFDVVLLARYPKRLFFCAFSHEDVFLFARLPNLLRVFARQICCVEAVRV